MMRYFAIAVVAALLAEPAAGQQASSKEREKLPNQSRIAKQSATITGDRGLLTIPSVETLGKGQYSIGAAWNNLDRTPTDIDVNQFPVYVSYGVFDRLSVSAAFEVQRQVTVRNLAQPGYNSSYPFAAATFQDGYGDTTLTAKYRLQRKKDRLGGIALRTFVKIPTASEKANIGTNARDFGADVIFTSGLPFGLLMHSNMGYTYTGTATQQPPPCPGICGSAVTPPLKVKLKDEMRSGFGAAWPSQGIAFLGGRTQAIAEYVNVALVGCCASANAASTAVQNSNEVTFGVRHFLFDQGLTLDVAYRNNTKFDDTFAGNTNPHGWTFGLAYTSPGSIDLNANGKPIVALDTPETEIAAGTRAALTAAALDPDNDRLRYAWTTTGGQVVPSQTAPEQATFTGPTGTHTVTVTVSDGKGGVATADLQISVKP